MSPRQRSLNVYAEMFVVGDILGSILIPGTSLNLESVPKTQTRTYPRPPPRPHEPDPAPATLTHLQHQLRVPLQLQDFIQIYWLHRMIYTPSTPSTIFSSAGVENSKYIRPRSFPNIYWSLQFSTYKFSKNKYFVTFRFCIDSEASCSIFDTFNSYFIEPHPNWMLTPDQKSGRCGLSFLLYILF